MKIVLQILRSNIVLSILIIELVWAVITRFISLKITYITQIFISLILFFISFDKMKTVLHKDIIFELNHFLFLDSLNALILTALLFLFFCVSVYSVGYMKKEFENGLKEEKIKVFYFWMNLFVFCMSLVLLSNNFGIVWIAIEGTTLSTTFLIGFYNTKDAIKASWQYIIICSFGIAIGLFGVITLYFATYHILGEGMSALDWTNIIAIGKQLNPSLLKMAFVLFLVGFGTKAGLAPMHSWLPNAHSQSPTPTSALMSGVLLSSAFYVILRLKAVIDRTSIEHFASSLLLFIGLLTVFIATISIVRQKDYKRLLAYSSMEHMGLIAFAFGIGNKIGAFAGLFHLINHAFAKGLMFSSVGEILVNFHTRDIFSIRGLYKSMPLTALLVSIGVLGITGMPPFNMFASEFLIIVSAFKAHLYWEIFFILFCLVVIFGGFVYLFSYMLMGDTTESKKSSEWMDWSMFLLVAVMLYLGINIPDGMQNLMQKAVEVISG